jgi:RNA polymerase sigma-70 factor (ECF subfamily)
MRAKLDVTPHLEDLWRYARVLTRSDADADDLVQEALARALASAHSYDASRPLLTWLIAVVRNTFLTGLTRAKAETKRLETYSVVSGSLMQPAQEHSAELLNVQRVLLALPTEQAEVLHLVGVLGFTYADAAELLGVPTGTIMSRLSRARAALRDNMDRGDETAPVRLRVVGGRHGTD